MKRDIHLEWFLAFPPGEVWTCLTDPELIGQWLMKNDFQPVVGHRFQFRDKPKKGFGWDGIVHCQVLEVIPEEKLSFRWQGGPGDGSLTLDSVVTWTLVAQPGGTRLVLDHTGFSGFKGLIASMVMKKGWAHHVIRRFINILTERNHAHV